MSLPKDELHRLIDAIPEDEEPTVRRFLQFVLAESTTTAEVSAVEAASRLGVKAKTLRQWLRDGRIPARKEGTRWFVKEKDLALYLDPTARAFLTAPLSREHLSADEKQRSEQGWQDYLDGKASPPTSDLAGISTKTRLNLG